MLTKPTIEQTEDEQLAEEIPSDAPTENEEEEAVEEDGGLVHPDDLKEDEEPTEEYAEESEEEEAPGASDTDAVVNTLREELALLREELTKSRSSQDSDGSEDTGGIKVEPISGISFVGEDEDVTDLTMSASGMNEFGSRILNSAVQASVTHAFELARSEASKAVSTYAYSKEFYDRYPELRDHGDVVESMSKDIEKRKPDITPQELFIETAKRSYAKLGKKMPGAKKTNPGFTNARSAQGSQGKRQRKHSEQDDVLELLKHKGRL